ncbi:MAG: hypothetical protein NVSMB44_33210 [Ktedonobacteraceae bacterium]
MRGRWWQSIRWRLALGSVLLALLTTSLLALTAVIVTNYNYGTDQKTRLDMFASDKAQNIGSIYASQSKKSLYLAAKSAILAPGNVPDQQPTTIILAKNGFLPIYPALTFINRVQGSKPASIQGTLERSILEFVDPSVQNSDFTTFNNALRQARRGIDTNDSFGNKSPVNPPQAFAVRPIFPSGQRTGPANTIIGILVATTRTDTIPSFVSTIGKAVFVASFIITFLAAVIAIIFSQTITRPLERLTKASRILASGNYDARVTTKAPGELGELAQSFNEMAVQLKRDVEELRQQEVWRRELIMNITHDLATPLTAIAGLGEALVDGINQSREDYEATGSIIVRETLRLRRLVQDLHVMAKLEAGALQPKKKLLRLAALVDEILAVQATEFERHQIEPNNTVAFDLPVVEADPDMLIRVFSNLFINALRHTPPGGMVTIAAKQQENMLLLSITDTGEGIPQEALARIFERFYRVDSARQSSKGGSGLGLAIVRAIVESHGGTIWAENAPGAGARICFTLPISTREQFPIQDVPTLPITPRGSHQNIHPIRLKRVDIDEQTTRPA